MSYSEESFGISSRNLFTNKDRPSSSMPGSLCILKPFGARMLHFNPASCAAWIPASSTPVWPPERIMEDLTPESARSSNTSFRSSAKKWHQYKDGLSVKPI